MQAADCVIYSHQYSSVQPRQALEIEGELMRLEGKLCDLLSSNCVTQALFDLLISNCHAQARKHVALIQERRGKWSPWPVGEKLCLNTKMRPLVPET